MGGGDGTEGKRWVYGSVALWVSGEKGGGGGGGKIGGGEGKLRL